MNENLKPWQGIFTFQNEFNKQWNEIHNVAGKDKYVNSIHPDIDFNANDRPMEGKCVKWLWNEEWERREESE